MRRSSAPRSQPATHRASSSTRRRRPCRSSSARVDSSTSTASRTAPPTSPNVRATAATSTAPPDGGLYQMPWKANPVMIIYNKAIFEAAGLDPDNPPLGTYDEFTATAQTLGGLRRRAGGDLAAPGQPVLPAVVRLLPAVHRPERNGARRGRTGDVRVRRRVRRRRLLAWPLRRRVGAPRGVHR